MTRRAVCAARLTVRQMVYFSRKVSSLVFLSLCVHCSCLSLHLCSVLLSLFPFVFRGAITCISFPQCSEACITHAHRSARITDSVSFVYLPVQAAVAVDGERLLLYLGLGLDLRVVLDLGRTRLLRARRLTRRTPVFQLAVRARGARRAEAFQLAVGARLALRAAVFHLAVRAGVAVHEDVFHLAVRAAVALRTVAFQLAVGAARARHAVVFYLAAQATLPTSPFHHY